MTEAEQPLPKCARLLFGRGFRLRRAMPEDSSLALSRRRRRLRLGLLDFSRARGRGVRFFFGSFRLVGSRVGGFHRAAGGSRGGLCVLGESGSDGQSENGDEKREAILHKSGGANGEVPCVRQIRPDASTQR